MTSSHQISTGLVLRLGFSQLICWGVSFYLIGVFGEPIAADLGWSREGVFGGFSMAILAMGLVSPLVGRMIDRLGGGPVMSLGTLLTIAGCVFLSFCESYAAYLAAWVALGLGMRCTLYDAAFATLARIGGAGSGRAMAQITLLGGLAATALWPLGHAMIEAWGWRGALLGYAAISLLTLPLHLSLPSTKAEEGGARAERRPPPLAAAPRDRRIAGALYAIVVLMTNFLNSGMTAHMIGILSGLGLAAWAAVWVASVRGIGQSTARLGEVLFGAGLHPLSLNLAAAAAAPVAFVIALFSGQAAIAALGFAFAYGASNGLLTITRGTMPLTLFPTEGYGALVGRLVAPSWIVSAAAPLAYAFVIERFGAVGGLAVSIAAGAIMAVAGFLLWLLYRPERRLALQHVC